MMTLQGWRSMFTDQDKRQFMESRLWQSFSSDWVWELAVVDTDVIKRLHRLMYECEQQVLDKLLDGLLLHAVQETELVAMLSQQLGRPKQQILSALQSFSQSGFVCLFEHPWQGSYWLMPLPIFHSWRAALYHPLDVQHNIRLELPESLQRQCSYAHPLSLIVRLLLFIHELSRQSSAFTKQGSLKKLTIKQLNTHQQQLAPLSTLQHVWKHSFADSKGGVESFLFELAYDLELFEFDSEGLSWNTDKLREWLQLAQRDQDELIWHWLLQHLTPQYDRSVIVFMHDVMNGRGNWLQFDQKTEQTEHSWLNEQANLKYRRQVQQQSAQVRAELQQLLQMFSECGLVSYSIEYAQGAGAASIEAYTANEEQLEERIYVRREYASPSYNELHLEHNGELLALPGTRPYLIWQALEAAELISAQELLVLRITPQSLQRYAATGYAANELKSWLQQYSNGELPELVGQLLQHVETDMNADKNTLTSQIIPLNVSELYSAATSGVTERAEHYIYYELRKLVLWGCYCANPLGLLVQAERLPPQHVCQYLRREAVGSITRSWQHELRCYHSSTILQIVEAAIQFGFGLYVKVGSKLSHVVPQFLEEKDGKTYLSAAVYAMPALKPLEIELTGIEAIQLDVDEGKGA